MGLDRGTKIYAAILGAILLAWMIAWLLTLDGRLGEIDDMLGDDPELAAYPYQFRALEIENKTAVISTPRSTRLPAVRFLGMIKPGLANKSEQDPAVIAAQKELASLQSKVRELVTSREDIDKVRWRLDKEWYASRGIIID